MKKWITIDSIGDIYVEKELIRLDYPLFFIAAIKEKKYLVFCLDNEEGEYLFAKTTYLRILKMLNGKTDIREITTNASELMYVSYDYNNRKYLSRRVDVNEIPEEDLPDKDTYFTIDTPDLDEYKWQVASKLCFDSLKQKRESNTKSVNVSTYKKEKDLYNLQLNGYYTIESIKFSKHKRPIKKQVEVNMFAQNRRNTYNKYVFA